MATPSTTTTTRKSTGGAFDTSQYGAGAVQQGLTNQQIAANNFASSVTGMGPVGTGGAGEYLDYGQVLGYSPGQPVSSIPFEENKAYGEGRPASPGAGRFQVNQNTMGRYAATPNEALRIISEMPKERQLEWKQGLYDAGLYDPSFYSQGRKPRQVGLLDDDDRQAFGRLFLNVLNAPPGTTAQGALEMLKEDNPYSAKNNYGRPKSVSQYSIADPATIRQIARTAATELLGRDLDDKSMEALVGKIQAQQTGAAQAGASAVNAAQNAGQGGVIGVQDVDVNARTKEEIMNENPAEVAAKKFANGYDVFMKLMLGGSQ